VTYSNKKSPSLVGALKNLLQRRNAQLAFVAVASVMVAAPVAADTVQEVTVEAPPTITTTPVDQTGTPGGAQVEITTVKVGASYADLDLSKSSDVMMLRSRIETAAISDCKRLDKLYPLQQDANCVDRAVETAMPQVEAEFAAVGR